MCRDLKQVQPKKRSPSPENSVGTRTRTDDRTDEARALLARIDELLSSRRFLNVPGRRHVKSTSMTKHESNIAADERELLRLKPNAAFHTHGRSLGGGM